ncbi:MAG: hypothetical protein C0448_15560 [Sphingobacteriaceae bacterium]|nr:hypothetical protein [Sphingobacteriaceae bacterium]
MEINTTRTITEKEGYEAMLHTLHYYWQLTDSNDLTDILSGGEYLADGKPADSAFYEYWLEAIEKVRKDGPLYKQLK